MSASSQQPQEYQTTAIKPKGLNERLRFVNPDAAEFDTLRGYIQQTTGVLERAPGILQYFKFPGAVMSGCQTFDDRQNVIIQTNQGVYLLSEDELMGRVSSSNLIPVPLNEEETMSKAIFTHALASGVNSGVATVANVWTQAPLNTLVSQLNPDGTPAAFTAAPAANRFTLSAGVYRFNCRCLAAGNAAGRKLRARLFNVTTGLAAWAGLTIEAGPWIEANANSRNIELTFGGDLQLMVPTTFEIQVYSDGVGLANGMGFAEAVAGQNELYRYLEVLKTA